MGHVFDFQEAGSYDAWFEQAKNRYCLDLEIKLMMDILSPQKGQRILEVGCGTGIILESMMDKGVYLTGIDPSPYMLDLAQKRLGSKVDLHRGGAEDLPFEDNAFDCVLFFTSLEFTDRPAKAIEEACRVAKDKVILCVLNRYAPLNLLNRFKSFFIPSIYIHAHFFSIWELKRILFAILGKVPIKWKTTLQFPFACGKIAGFFESMSLVQKSFFGTLICMKIKPVPKFRTRPLEIRVKKSKGYEQAPGMATRMRQ